MNIVENKSRKILTQAIYDLAKKENTEVENIQLMIENVGGIPEFFGYKDFTKKLEHLPTNKLYPTAYDVFGIRQQIPMFIANLMDDICNEFKSQIEITTDDVRLLILEVDLGKKKDLKVIAYKDTSQLKIIDFKDVFGQQAIMRMMAKQ